jgi:hypothetical protein
MTEYNYEVPDSCLEKIKAYLVSIGEEPTDVMVYAIITRGIYTYIEKGAASPDNFGKK